MNKKLLIVLEMMIIFLAMIYYVVKEMIPEYKENRGSSDHFINSSQVVNLIEIEIDHGLDFVIALNEKTQISHLYFFDKQSNALYNKDIESKKIEDGVTAIVSILKQNAFLRNESQVEIYYTNEKQYDLFMTSWNKALQELSLSPMVIERKQDIKEKATQLDLDTSSFSSMLWEMDLYSKEMIKDSDLSQEILTEKTSIEYANNIYQKLEQMANSKENADIPISLIPADENHKIYPTENSWYKIENQKVYAWIEIRDNHSVYSYCYQGSINERVKGECQ